MTQVFCAQKDKIASRYDVVGGMVIRPRRHDIVVHKDDTRRDRTKDGWILIVHKTEKRENGIVR